MPPTILRNALLPDIAIVAAVNDRKVLAANLQRSPAIAEAGIPLHAYENCRSAGEAYNRGMDEANTELVAFVHQDVYLPGSWLERLACAVDKVSRIDPSWALLAPYGVLPDGRHVGCVWDSGIGRLLGSPPPEPVPVVSVDELAFVVRRSAGLRFDEALPGFHLYGTDIVLALTQIGASAYVVDTPVIHNSEPVRTLFGCYGKAYRFTARKWRDRLPTPTVILPLTRRPYILWRRQLRVWWKATFRGSTLRGRLVDPVAKAAELGLE